MSFRDLIDVGQQCKRLLDAGRVLALEAMGFDVDLHVGYGKISTQTHGRRRSFSPWVSSPLSFPLPHPPLLPPPQLYTEASITPENVLLIALPKQAV